MRTEEQLKSDISKRTDMFDYEKFFCDREAIYKRFLEDGIPNTLQKLDELKSGERKEQFPVKFLLQYLSERSGIVANNFMQENGIDRYSPMGHELIFSLTDDDLIADAFRDYILPEIPEGWAFNEARYDIANLLMSNMEQTNRIARLKAFGPEDIDFTESLGRRYEKRPQPMTKEESEKMKREVEMMEEERYRIDYAVQQASSKGIYVREWIAWYGAKTFGKEWADCHGKNWDGYSPVLTWCKNNAEYKKENTIPKKKKRGFFRI